MILLRALAAAAAVLAAGCATVMPQPQAVTPETNLNWDRQQAAIVALSEWDLSGRFAIRTDEQAVSANLRWIRTSAQDRIYLFGMLGGGKIQLEVAPESVALRDANGREYFGARVSEVLYRATGWHVPFDSLGSWLRGIPASAEEIQSIEITEDGKLRRLSQSGWDIDYREFMTVGSLELPKKINMIAQAQTVQTLVEADQLQGDQLSIRFFVESWGGPVTSQEIDQ